MGGASRFISLLTTPSPFLLLRRTSLLRHSLSPLSTSSHHLTPSLSPRPQSRFRPPKASSIHTQTTTTNQDNNRNSLGCLSGLVDSLSSAGYFGNQRLEILVDDAFVADEKLSDEFVRASSACLAFAHDRSDILGLLSRRDISVVVETGTPFLFKSALDTTRRMRAFLGLGSSYEFDSNKAHTVDLMKYLLSYASNPTVSSERSNLCTEGLIESAVRNLLSELTRLGCGIPAPESSASVQHQFPDRYGQTPRPLGQNLEMKRGDWICPRCTFMNFARNAKCLECEEARPKRQLTGGEWECPQCDFFNYGRNPLCIRCDCKRPVDASFGITDSSSVLGHGNGLYGNKPDIDGRLAANEDKAQRRLANAQFQRDAANTGSSEILGRTSAVSDGDKNNVADGQNAETTSSPSLSRSTSPQFGHPKGRHSSYVPFVPLPKDM